eukprot:gene8111-1357_t
MADGVNPRRSPLVIEGRSHFLVDGYAYCDEQVARRQLFSARMSAIINRSSQLSASGHRNDRCSACMGVSRAHTAKPMVHRAPRSSIIMAAMPSAGTKDKLAALLSQNKKWAKEQAKIDPEFFTRLKDQQIPVDWMQWAKEQAKNDPEFFTRLKDQQSPEYLWIGCSDSRVPANTILGMDPGEIFVQRNAIHRDMNCMSCIEFSVTVLGVNTIIVCGHYKCGAVKAALTLPSKTPGMTNCWIADIREARNQHRDDLVLLSEEKQVEKLCEYNVLRQVYHVCTSPTVQQCWDEGKELIVYGVCYSLEDGLLKQLAGPIASNGGMESFSKPEFVAVKVRENAMSALKALLAKNKEPVVEVEVPKITPPILPQHEKNTKSIRAKLAAHAGWDNDEH